jgi:hypothetical protein
VSGLGPCGSGFAAMATNFLENCGGLRPSCSPARASGVTVSYSWFPVSRPRQPAMVAALQQKGRDCAADPNFRR